MKRILLISALIASFCIGDIAARKEYKQIRSSLKAGRNDEAANLVEKAKKDSSMMNDPELYLLGAEAQKKINDDYNKKLYLKQLQKTEDSIRLFSSTYGIFENLIKCDELESRPDKKGRSKPKNRGKIRSTLSMYRPNLFNAGLFFVKKKQYAEANKYFSMYINVTRTPIFIADSLQNSDTKMPRSAFWSMACCYALNDYKGVFNFEKLAMRDTANIKLCIQYQALSYAALKDMPNMVGELKQGLRYDGNDLFFFSRLADYYNAVKDYDKGLALCDSMIKTDDKQLMYKYAKSVVLFHQKKYDECIALSQYVIANDSTNVDANYYMASCYFNKATAIDDNIKANVDAKTYNSQKAAARELFQKALPYFENYRKKRPSDSARWAAPLYRIYLFLNMGKQFSEMDNLLKQADQQKQAEAQKANAKEEKKK